MGTAQFTYERRGKTITDIETGTAKTYKFFNEAKRASRAIQQSNGGLGCGALKVVQSKATVINLLK